MCKNKMSIGIDKFKEILSEMKNELLDELLIFINDLKERTNFISAKQHALNEKVNGNERDSRRKNLIIKGFRETEENTKNLEESLLEFINSKLQVKVDLSDIDIVFRVGEKQLNCAKERLIILKLTSERKKNEILKNKLKLKGSNIFIDNDYCKEDLKKFFESRQRKKHKKNVNKSDKNCDKISHRSSSSKNNIRKNSPKTSLNCSTPMPLLLPNIQ
jgi:hypothetical protein